MEKGISVFCFVSILKDMFCDYRIVDVEIPSKDVFCDYRIVDVEIPSKDVFCDYRIVDVEIPLDESDEEAEIAMRRRLRKAMLMVITLPQFAL